MGVHTVKYWIIFSIFVLCLPQLPSGRGAEARQRPNIVVVLVDDLRWDELGCSGHPFVRTPHIDRIAREGAQFRNAFCTTPLCSPVRACLLTGLHTHHHGILDNTAFVFTSDHGYWYSEHGLSVERRLAYEEGIRVPLLIRYPPWTQTGRLIDSFALSIDLAPTLLEAADVAQTRPMDGHSLAPLLKGDTPPNWRSSFLIQYNSDTVFPRVQRMGYRAVRTHRWKYIRYQELDQMDELYDLLNDPYEMQNVAAQPSSAAILNELQAELSRLLNPK